MSSRYRHFLIYKPYGMLSQFSKEGEHKTLADLDFAFPKDAYPLGRLDADSEGMLLLTNDATINARLLDPEKGHEREYLIQVDGEVTDEALAQLSRGVELSIDGKKFNTRPARALRAEPPTELPERNPPVRFRKAIPTSWISLSLTEGKNRQVRRMTAAVGFPTLRLLRVRIGALLLTGWTPGYVRELSADDIRLTLQRKK